MSTPMRLICCARAAIGHAAAPATSVMNSRRLNRSNCIRCPQPEWQHNALARITSGACRSAEFRFGLSQLRANSDGLVPHVTFPLYPLKADVGTDIDFRRFVPKAVITKVI